MEQPRDTLGIRVFTDDFGNVILNDEFKQKVATAMVYRHYDIAVIVNLQKEVMGVTEWEFRKDARYLFKQFTDEILKSLDEFDFEKDIAIFVIEFDKETVGEDDEECGLKIMGCSRNGVPRRPPKPEPELKDIDPWSKSWNLN